MLRKLVLLAAAAAMLSATPALAQRGGGGDRDGDRDRGGHNDNRGGRDRDDDRGGRDWDRGRDRDWDRHRGHDRDWNDSWSLSLSLGSLFAPRFDSYRYSPPYPVYSAPSYNAWGLSPYQCRWDVEFGYWYNRPAALEVRRCADQWGNPYIVQGSQRLLRFR